MGRDRRGRRGLTVLLTVSYAVTAVGVPLPVGAQHRKSAELFPCANCGCGCPSAEFCWRSCCCHTLAERLAWARKHGVRPPAFAIAEAQRAGFDVGWLATRRGVGEGFKRKSCCIAKAKNTCCAKRTTSQSHVKTRRHVVAWQAMKCGGQSLDWLAAVPTLILPPLALSHTLPRLAWLNPASSETAESLLAVPVTPPPERA